MADCLYSIYIWLICLGAIYSQEALYSKNDSSDFEVCIFKMNSYLPTTSSYAWIIAP